MLVPYEPPVVVWFKILLSTSDTLTSMVAHLTMMSLYCVLRPLSVAATMFELPVLLDPTMVSVSIMLWDTANRWRIRVGSTWANSGGTVYNTAQIINHPDYNARTINNDVAILRASSTFSLNNNVQAGSIAGPTYNLGDNQAVWAVGWGTTTFGGSASEQLRHVHVWTVNQATCRTRYAEIGIDCHRQHVVFWMARCRRS
ncbi:unnamed protein product [Parnassius apollo]|uniref:(apollo) hypothetical protein n=1 Tax=Parnassius apollo TaxID=110799 RepID=A0A8S3WUV4_PARAO|nr:unnamed protein product [Parnassius apollo]